MKNEIKEILIEDKAYPPLLKSIPLPPKKLYILGDLSINNQPCISIVGTRKASDEGKKIAKKIAQELGDLNFIIVSGLALGIDSYAHLGALNSKNGKTIAVLANGLDKIYPKTNENIAKKILEKNGTIISEYPPNTSPLPHYFLQRNRIISGLSIATIIIEAPIKSGALTTARYALEQGREVLVFPGSIENKNYQGSHFLIRSGARLVTNLNDILEDLQEIISDQYPEFNNLKNEQEKKEKNFDEIDNLILKILKEKNKLTLQEIKELTNLPLEKIIEHLTILILNNLIKENNNYYEYNK